MEEVTLEDSKLHLSSTGFQITTLLEALVKKHGGSEGAVRVRLEKTGPTFEERPMPYVYISVRALSSPSFRRMQRPLGEQESGREATLDLGGGWNSRTGVDRSRNCPLSHNQGNLPLLIVHPCTVRRARVPVGGRQHGLAGHVAKTRLLHTARLQRRRLQGNLDRP